MPHDYASFIKSFFLTSDNPVDHAGYVENFTADATLKVGLRTAVGKDRKATFTKISIWAVLMVLSAHLEIRALRESESEEDSVMMFGHVDYTLKNGRSLTTEWSSRMVFDESREKMKFYQVWLDASPMIVAMGRRIEADESGNMQSATPGPLSPHEARSARRRVAASARKRIANACLACKSRKQRCDGQQPCNICSRRGAACIYVEQPSRQAKRRRASQVDVSGDDQTSERAGVKQPRSSSSPNQNRNNQYVHHAQTNSSNDVHTDSQYAYPTPSHGNPKLQSMESNIDPNEGVDTDDDTVEAPIDLRTCLLSDPSGRLLYIGETGSLSFLARMRKLVKDALGQSPFTSNSEQHSIADKPVIPRLQHTLGISVSLPPLECATALVDLFFVHINSVYYVLDHEKMEQVMAVVYSGGLLHATIGERNRDIAFVNSICAVGTFFTKQPELSPCYQSCGIPWTPLYITRRVPGRHELGETKKTHLLVPVLAGSVYGMFTWSSARHTGRKLQRPSVFNGANKRPFASYYLFTAGLVLMFSALPQILCSREDGPTGEDDFGKFRARSPLLSLMGEFASVETCTAKRYHSILSQFAQALLDGRERLQREEQAQKPERQELSIVGPAFSEPDLLDELQATSTEYFAGSFRSRAASTEPASRESVAAHALVSVTSNGDQLDPHSQLLSSHMEPGGFSELGVTPVGSNLQYDSGLIDKDPEAINGMSGLMNFSSFFEWLEDGFAETQAIPWEFSWDGPPSNYFMSSRMSPET
ncbi:hypothetical protein BDD12DRAFT_804582 [Trichophaea hybrida]|nr:hypothetical protein BDD12DRAFT_804582 [Trichophaea hybrida]